MAEPRRHHDTASVALCSDVSLERTAVEEFRALGHSHGGFLTEENESLRVLIVEDEPDDAALLANELQRFGYAVSADRVDTEETFLEALEPQPDVILADYTLPQFNALRALRGLQRRELDIPFVVVTGTTGEESAVEVMREGAHDYLLKDRLARLGPAVSRALNEKRLRDENRRVESELRRSEVWSRKMFESSPDAVIVSNGEGRIVDWNPQAEATFGWSRNEALGRSLVDTLLPPRRRKDYPKTLESFLCQGEATLTTERLETTALKRDGDPIPVEMTITPLQVGDDWILGTFVRDLSEKERSEDRRQLLERQLRQAQRMEAVGRLASGVAQDFNNVLTVISGQCDLLMRSGTIACADQERLKEIDLASSRAASLTRQLLAFSRRQVLQPTVLDVNSVLEEMDDMLARVLGADILIEMELANGLGHVNADRAQLEHVVMNLAVNAREAMPHGGKLTLRTAVFELEDNGSHERKGLPRGRYVRLEVIDRGDGMDDETLGRIFEPFYTTKALGRGTGLGLSTVYGIVKQSSGFIYVTSERFIGTRFEILLPRVDEPITVSSEAAPTSMLGQGRILVVEDEEPLRKLTREFLEECGFSVLESKGGRDAFSLIEAEDGNIDLVVTNVAMPGMSGDELASLLAARYSRIKVLYVSGQFERELAVPVEQGRRELLSKPFSRDDLIRRVTSLLSAPSETSIELDEEARNETE